eukprot:7579015-Pyramimonas_sp.AAC.1
MGLPGNDVSRRVAYHHLVIALVPGKCPRHQAHSPVASQEEVSKMLRTLQPETKRTGRRPISVGYAQEWPIARITSGAGPQ